MLICARLSALRSLDIQVSDSTNDLAIQKIIYSSTGHSSEFDEARIERDKAEASRHVDLLGPPCSRSPPSNFLSKSRRHSLSNTSRNFLSISSPEIRLILFFSKNSLKRSVNVKRRFGPGSPRFAASKKQFPSVKDPALT